MGMIYGLVIELDHLNPVVSSGSRYLFSLCRATVQVLFSSLSQTLCETLEGASEYTTSM